MSITIALLTDVHGNPPALKAVLEEIDKASQIDHIYCLGDMIGIGPFSNEVLDLLFCRQDVSMVSGNHDEAILALIQGEEYPKSHRNKRVHHEWIADRLDKRFIPKLLGLPRIIRQRIDGQNVVFVHYHIKPSRLNDHICSDPFSPIVHPDFSNLEELFKDYHDNIVCFGHHHPVHFFQRDNQVFINPGSLGCNDKPTARYATLTIDETTIHIELREVPYDNSAFLASYEKLKVPSREFILKVFHGGQKG